MLPQRQKDVLSRRFGLQNGAPETLQNIGDDFSITRERVRQIEREGFSRLAGWKEDKGAKDVFSHFNQYLLSYGGLRREDLALEDLGGKNYQNHVYFILTIGDSFHRFSEDEKRHPFWAIENEIDGRVLNIIEMLLEKFRTEKRPLAEEEFLRLVQEEPVEFFNSVVEIARDVEKSPLGFFGLAQWPEIKPRGVRDVAFLVLKKSNNPLHFRQIAEVANGLGNLYPRKQVLPQTVHNELIRDARFVLVGRGIYALKEWGYNSGTVRDVIIQILKDSENALTKDEIVDGVMKQRHVRANTILLNLHNKRYFLRNSEGRYALK